MAKEIRVLCAPSILGLRQTGVELLASTLIKAGRLQSQLKEAKVVDVPTFNSEYSSHRDPETDCLNFELIRDFSYVLKAHIEEQIESNCFPVVLGGDCSILIGIMPGLKCNGNFGLIFIDAHADFYEPARSVTGEVADMDLAIVTGRGPELLTNIDGLRPYIDDRNVVHIGQRDAEQAREYGSQDIKETEIAVFDFASVKSKGIEDITEAVINRMGALKVDGFWIHFDTDVISDEENPAVDYRLPGGLTFREAEHLLTRLVDTGRIIGLDVTIFNPVLDTDGEIAVKISNCLGSAFDRRHV